MLTLEGSVILVALAVIIVTEHELVLLCVSSVVSMLLSCLHLCLAVSLVYFSRILSSEILTYQFKLVMVNKMVTVVVPFYFRASHCSGVHGSSSRHCKCTRCNLGVLANIMAISSVFYD